MPTAFIARILLAGLGLLAFTEFETVVGAAAQTDDLAKGLVGRWEGQVEGLRRTTELALVITSVERDGEFWSVIGRMGAREHMGAIGGTLETVRGERVLRFTSGRGDPVELSVAKDGTHLAGYMHRWGPGGGSRLPVRLEKILSDTVDPCGPKGK